MARQHERRVDHVVLAGLDPQARELASIVGAGLERLVGQEGDAPARRPQGRDRVVGPGNQRLAAVHGAVEIEEPAAVRQGEAGGHGAQTAASIRLAQERRDGGLGEIHEGRRHDAE